MKHNRGGIKTWLIFILLIILLFGGLLWLQQRRQAPDSPVERPSVDDTVDITTPEKPRKEFAIPELSEEEKKARDNKALADALRGSGDCESIEFDEELKQTCIDNKLFDRAILNKSESLCNQISDETRKQECLDSVFLGLATDTNDLSLCEKIVDETIRQRCLDQLNVRLGYTAQSADECNVIADPDIRANCLDNFYLTASLNEASLEGCEQIASSKVKEECIVSVERQQKVSAAIESQMQREFISNEEKLDKCDQLSGADQTECKDNVNYALALEKKDLSFCNVIEDSDKQNDCVSKQSANINRFYLKQAIATKDSTICDRILDSSLRATCLQYAQ